RGEPGGDVSDDISLDFLIPGDALRVEEEAFFGRPDPCSAAGAVDVGEGELGFWQRGPGVPGEVGDEGLVPFDACGIEAAAQVAQGGFADIGGRDGDVGVEILDEDGFAAAGGAGIPECCRRVNELKEFADALGTEVLDDDFLVGGKLFFDL